MAAGKSTAYGAHICFADESGQSLIPPRGRTWAPRGARPVAGRRGGRVNIAGAVCFKPWWRPRMCFKLHVFRRRRGEAKTFAWSAPGGGRTEGGECARLLLGAVRPAAAWGPASRESAGSRSITFSAGISVLECARRLGVALNTVNGEALRAARRARTACSALPSTGPASHAPYRDHLRHRRAENPAVPVNDLLAEIREQGYRQRQPSGPLHQSGPRRVRPRRSVAPQGHRPTHPTPRPPRRRPLHPA